MKSTFLANLHHFCALTDGTYAFPNSQEGDLLKTAKTEIDLYWAGIASLCKEIHRTERLHSEACLNGTIAQQVGHSSTAATLKHALALVTGTAVSGAQFNAILEGNR